MTFSGSGAKHVLTLTATKFGVVIHSGVDPGVGILTPDNM